ncbi:alpha/beta hydrolase [Streptomyces sp. TRM49041]|uniref:alpha/beta hydrolase n=1 Tax=Streptomyces sp. TRM49041 TaxID=2603216 RepID=UPI001CA42658|nr:alpha/beta hydrolase [Streptomyces sp. TRM49041]
MSAEGRSIAEPAKHPPPAPGTAPTPRRPPPDPAPDTRPSHPAASHPAGPAPPGADTTGPDRPAPAPGRPARTAPRARSALRAVAAFAALPYRERTDPRRVVRCWPDLTALCAATVFFWLSLTPSLVPRPWILQGVIGGITAAIGYAVGATLSGLPRAVVRWRPRAELRRAVRVRGWQAYWLLSPVVAGSLISESAQMQRRLRQLQGLPPTLTWHTVMIALTAVALCALLLLVARLVRLGARRLIRALGGWLPRPVAVGAGLALTAMTVTVGIRDVVFDRGIVDVADRIAEATNRGTKDGITRPASRYVSGGPGSLLGWQDLGFQGRNFTGTTPTRHDISAYTGRPAKDPVRVYVSSQLPRVFGDGDDGNTPFRAQARLAVRELERTGAFTRKVLAIAGTTGSGWIDSNVAQSLEYLHGGDTAIVAVQYSYLPSWVSFLVDKEKAGKATRELVDAVRARLDTLPAAGRPKLVVTGESLGAYAVEASFGSVEDLMDATDGALLLGAPNFSPLSRQLREDRDPGSPVWRPQYRNGLHVRVAQFPAVDLRRPAGGPWAAPRVVYLQNASDPIVWWSPDLLFERPEWMDEPLGPDITSEINWFPFVAFWQTTVDMAVSYGVQAPHGHRYGAGAVDGWAAVVPPDGWTEQDTRRLRTYIAGRKTPY